ncbi:MAG: hypothetical protein IK096_07135 [Lachnospiraceae bacterium]|nr:hypothetical protein [Lachnospiraceae bacterium]
MQQIVVITNRRKYYENTFKMKGYYVNWCDLEINAIISVRDRSNVFVFCLEDADPDLLDKVGYYMRDLCIEDEKIVYLFGRKDSVDHLKNVIPSLFVQKALYLYGTTDMLMDELKQMEEAENKNTPALLVVDDDQELVEQLRIMLGGYFRFYVTHYDILETRLFIKEANVVLMGTRGRYSMLDIMDLLRLIAQRKMAVGMSMYYLTEDEKESTRVNGSGPDKGSLAYSRDTDPRVIADVLQAAIKEIKSE